MHTAGMHISLALGVRLLVCGYVVLLARAFTFTARVGVQTQGHTRRQTQEQTCSSSRHTNAGTHLSLRHKQGQRQRQDGPGRLHADTEDDGYSQIRFIKKIGTRLWAKLVKKKPGKLILMRHGTTTLNKQRTFTGWIDTDLSPRGVKELEYAANLIIERGYSVDVIHTSRLKRAIRSSWIINKGMNQLYKPVFKSWRLNERMYGDVEGKSKPGMAEILGHEVVEKFKSGYKGRPPEMAPTHQYWHGYERKYRDLRPEEIPLTESLEDCVERSKVVWNERIKSDLLMGKNVLIMAHANSLRGLLKDLEGLGDEEITKVSIPNALPLCYEFDLDFNIVPQEGAVAPLRGKYLEDKKVLKGFLEAAIEREEREEREREREADKRRVRAAAGEEGETESSDPFKVADAQGISDLIDGFPLPEHPRDPSASDPQHLVLMHHGETDDNRFGIFTGWNDPPLNSRGVEQAKAAGQLFKLHGINFDAVYTSWLSRAIETAWVILNELDLLWLPLIKSWRLNERMCGALTGLSKKMVREQYGEAVYNQWMLSYDFAPPPVSPFDAAYPGNDERYVNNPVDLRYSVVETISRSIAQRQPKLHKKFPKTESLKDCMARTVPYFENKIVPDSLNNGRSVLIVSSETALRTLLLRLLDIPPERICEVEVPVGLPLVYSLKTKSLQLLDDGKERDDPLGQWKEHYFGQSPELLFKPAMAREEEQGQETRRGRQGTGRGGVYRGQERRDV